MSFRAKFRDEFLNFCVRDRFSPSPDVRGNIRANSMVSPLSSDTKFLSKIFEDHFLSQIDKFADNMGFKSIAPKAQNYYPDRTIIYNDIKLAIDVKSSYKTGESQISGMTLGTFVGYFRNNSSSKNIMFPYDEYAAHFIFGAIYDRISTDETRKYPIEKLAELPTPFGDVDYMFHEKYRIASDYPGSGNTKNIGSVKDIKSLINGTGPFRDLGEKVFEHYWKNYMTSDMARKKKTQRPFRNIDEYKQFLQRMIDIEE